MQEAIDRIWREAERFNDPTEREYWAGMRQAGHIVRRLMEEFEEGTRVKRG